MPSLSQPARHHLKRKLAAVAGRETADNQAEMDEYSDSTVGDDDTSSSDDEDFTENPLAKKRRGKLYAMSSKTKKLKPFPFMRLPPEIREKIYILVVANSNKKVVMGPSELTKDRLRRNLSEGPTRAWMWTTTFEQKRFRNLRLLRVSKVIYQEAAVVMYTNQVFAFTRLSALQTFLLLLRPETLDRLVHIQVDVGREEWQFMPGVASQMVQLHYLQTLEIFGLKHITQLGSSAHYLDSTDRPQSAWKVNVKSLDKIIGITIARNLYRVMFPFFHAIIRAGFSAADDEPPSSGREESEPASSQPDQPSLTTTSPQLCTTQASGEPRNDKEELRYKPLVGLDALVRALRVEEQLDGWGSNMETWPWGTPISEDLRSIAMSKLRRSRRRVAMKKELLMLMAKDSF